MTLRYSHLAPAHMQKAVNIPDSALNEKTIRTKLAQFNRVEQMVRIGNLLILLVGDAGIEPAASSDRELYREDQRLTFYR